MPDITVKKDVAPKHGRDAASALVRDLRALRRLAGQMRRKATSADDAMLRKMLHKREALLNSVRAGLSASDGERASNSSDREIHLGPEDKAAIAETVQAIAVLDMEAEHILKGRAKNLAGEIQKLKAAKKSRESYRKWT